MELEKQVCSLELAKRLKQLGIKQNSVWWWIEWFKSAPVTIQPSEYPQGPLEMRSQSVLLESRPASRDTFYFVQLPPQYEKENYIRYSAFTVGELGETLPRQVFNVYTVKAAHNARNGVVVADRTFWCWRYKEKERAKDVQDKDEFFAETEADARAKMLVYLVEID